jgi:ABC-2 type transport system permease protein
MTFLMPVLMAALFVIPGMLIERGMGVKKVAVLDGTGNLRAALTQPDQTAEADIQIGRSRRDLPSRISTEYIDVRGQNVDEAAKPYFAKMNAEKKTDRLDGVFLIPGDALTSPDAKLRYYSRSATDFMTQARLSSVVNRSVQHHRLAQRGIAPADLDKLLEDLRVEAVQLSKSGEQKKGGVANFFAGFILTALLIIPSFVYGLEIMRGIIQEKTDRVVEVLISSMTSSQLLIGKILGVAAVGLTQISVWFIMAGAVGGVGMATAMLAGDNNFLQLIRPSTFVYFLIFFMLAYLTYVCIYAIGGAVCNTEKEAQQLIAPITMLMMLPWFLMAAIITNPDSSLSVGFSLSPVFGPLTMYVRTLVAEPPMWHVLLSIAVSIATIALFFWITAKIFRVGILSYGKRPTLPELWRWVKVA